MLRSLVGSEMCIRDRAYDRFVSFTPEAFWRHPLILSGLLQCTSSVGDSWKTTVIYQQLVTQRRSTMRHADITPASKCNVPSHNIGTHTNNRSGSGGGDHNGRTSSSAHHHHHHPVSYTHLTLPTKRIV
eukprot:TRINITY_DN28013_c0_g1_i1.p1 TRINITY_DN28013_c0_g1~~TRINITY_DN28013_c0_g1_i1.p1  ORF type:complete len:129 (+),score=22.41 TRINITY_DN28013_c0_g1_i1:132-518(+)